MKYEIIFYFVFILHLICYIFYIIDFIIYISYLYFLFMCQTIGDLYIIYDQIVCSPIHH
jgi:hypothetical protein